MVRTFCPISPKQEERLIAVVDLPTPPFWFAIAIVLPKICIASFHLFVFHLQFFLFTGNDLPALLSKKWFMRQVFWHIYRKNLLFYANLSEEFFRFYLKIAPIWDKDILSYYAGFYYWKCFTWNIFCIFAWLDGVKHKKIGDFCRCFTWNILKSTVLQWFFSVFTLFKGFLEFFQRWFCIFWWFPNNSAMSEHFFLFHTVFIKCFTWNILIFDVFEIQIYWKRYFNRVMLFFKEISGD